MLPAESAVPPQRSVYRVIDANLNRLREALRVVEEHARFVLEHEQTAAVLKALRHEVRHIEQRADAARLLRERNTGDDPLGKTTRDEERCRVTADDVLRANLKRGQEASRVLEEYTKIAAMGDATDTAKRIRFALYDVEKALLEQPDG